MVKFYRCFFFILLVLSVASMLPSSEALGGPCKRLPYLLLGKCNLAECTSWCTQKYGGKASCYDNVFYHACICDYCT
uniref:Uncharacterized protein n=1 Tax=Nelumbo nucifera TaxID=4432 RepID=A0A822ZU26_NELNU|nr:TPA_asm: hypothetical protein HUJ06_003608 [Nelumbo nucifera]